jgi:hypothetical protein
MMDDLSPAELDLASQLSKLASDPSPAAREAIMGAVRTAVAHSAQPRRWPNALRLTAAAVVAVALVLGTSIFAFAASSTALPDSPAYGLRSVGEQLRIAILAPTDRELLRITFARDHFRQAQDIAHRDRPDAVRLLKDGRAYLDDARKNLPSVPSGEQGDVQNQLNQADAQQGQTTTQLGEQGEQ